MGKIVHGINAPLLPGTIVVHPLDAVQNRIPHIHVGRSHIDLSPKHLGTIGELPIRIRWKRSRFSSTERLRYGLSLPGSVKVPDTP